MADPPHPQIIAKAPGRQQPQRRKGRRGRITLAAKKKTNLARIIMRGIHKPKG
jgi:hypothetical protein